MSRILLHYVLPLLLPTLIFITWVVLTRHWHKGEKSMVERISAGPWFWLAVAGFALMTAGLVYIALSQVEPPGGTYEPPRMENGEVVPGRTVR